MPTNLYKAVIISMLWVIFLLTYSDLCNAFEKLVVIL
jgi:hypothetical protein